MFTLDDDINTQKVLQSAAEARLPLLMELLNKVTQRIVQSGPFVGMKLTTLLAQSAFSKDSYYRWNATQLLGCYEQELHASLEKALQRNPDVVVNIGCGGGYYAVGMARRLPQAHIYAFDISEEARELCALAAAQNGVADRIHIGSECSQKMLLELAGSGTKVLFISDCEGHEHELFNTNTAPVLAHCDLIIECHDFKKTNITHDLLQLFLGDHEVKIIQEGGRNPSETGMLNSLSSMDRWLLVCEFRPVVMSWLVCWSRPG